MTSSMVLVLCAMMVLLSMSTMNAQRLRGTNATNLRDFGVRRNIANMTDDEVRALSFKIIRQGVIFGRYHGHDLWQCPHGSIDFLPWHRRLISYFEATIGEPLPFWDWRLGVPRQLTEQALGLTTGFIYDRSFNTTRGIINQATWPIDMASSGVRNALSKTTFREFSQTLESIHATPHVRLGGDSSNTRYAGYDPAFWFNHCFVDGIWAYWQSLHMDDDIPDEITNRMNRAAFSNTMRWNLEGGQMTGLSVQDVDEDRDEDDSKKDPRLKEKSEYITELPDFISECAAKEALVLVVHNVTMKQKARHVKYMYDNGNETIYLTEFATFGVGRPMEVYPVLPIVEVIILEPRKYFPQDAYLETIMTNLRIVASEITRRDDGKGCKQLPTYEYVPAAIEWRHI